jgi:hypothetical protein
LLLPWGPGPGKRSSRTDTSVSNARRRKR